MYLSGLSAGLWTKGSLVQLPVRAHAWVVGLVPSKGHVRGNHTLMVLSLSLLVSKNKILKKIKNFVTFSLSSPSGIVVICKLVSLVVSHTTHKFSSLYFSLFSSNFKVPVFHIRSFLLIDLLLILSTALHLIHCILHLQNFHLVLFLWFISVKLLILFMYCVPGSVELFSCHLLAHGVSLKLLFWILYWVNRWFPYLWDQLPKD